MVRLGGCFGLSAHSPLKEADLQMASRLDGGNLSNTFHSSEAAPTMALAELPTQSQLAVQVLAEYSTNC